MSSGKYLSSNQILNWRKNQLSKGGNSENLDWLLDVGGGLGWSDLQKLKLFQDRRYRLDLSLQELSLIWQRHLHENVPLQYLLGKCPWRDFELEVNSSALIPRPETEFLIDIAFSKITSHKKGIGTWADLGTGSGVLAIALAKSLKGWSGHAVDCSKPALSLAQKNIERLVPNSNVVFHLGDWWEPLKPFTEKIDLVVSNPPYIPVADLKDLDPVVRNHEPNLALSGGLDGMYHSREIVKGSIQGLSSGGWLIFEHNYDQSERSLELLNKSGFIEVDFQRDLEGKKRFALGRKP